MLREQAQCIRSSESEITLIGRTRHDEMNDFLKLFERDTYVSYVCSYLAMKSAS